MSLPRAANLHGDALQPRDLLPGRKLEGERPPRMVRRAPEPGARRQRVQLEHHPVDLVVEFVTAVGEPGVIRDGLLDVRDLAGAVGGPKPPRAQGLDRIFVGKKGRTRGTPKRASGIR